MKRLYLLYAALCAALACTAALSAALPLASVDGAALQSMAEANERTARALELGTCASERSAVSATATGCTDTVCRISIAAIAALTPCAAQRFAGLVQAQAAPAPQIIQTQREIGTAERVVGLFGGVFGKLFDGAIAVAPSLFNYKLGLAQSINQTALGIAQSNNGLAAQQSTNGTFAAFGNNIQGTAAAGFGANAQIASAGFNTASLLGSRPTQQISAGAGSAITLGNGNQTQIGNENRQASPGPCNPVANVTTPATASATPTTGAPPVTAAPAPVVTLTSDCAK